MRVSNFVRSTTALALAAMTLAACQSMGSRERGVLIGTAVGGAAGGVIGKHQGSTAKGAIIGAVVGGVVGGVIGHQMDQQAKELEQNIPGAVVERVGEGIQVTFESGLLFDFDSDRIKSTAANNLNNLASSLDRYPNTDLLVIGHTDAVGTDSYNMDLSNRRARSAALYLVNRGVDPNRLRTMGLGETEPVASNDTDAGRAQNRRVEIAIYASDEYRASLARQYNQP